MNIIQFLCNKYSNSSNRKIKYIVVHYTASAGGKAKGVANFFKTSTRKGSAHYVVDDTSIYQCVPDNKVAWSVGDNQKYPCKGGATLKGICTNTNSISIEMCCHKKSTKTLNATDTDWYFDDKTLENTIWLVDMLQRKYGVSINNVIRHSDVTGKYCPNPFVMHSEQWNSFKERVRNYGKTEKKVEVDDEMVTTSKIIVNGKEYTIERILKNDVNYIKLRDIEKIGLGKVDYDSEKKMPSITNK